MMSVPKNGFQFPLANGAKFTIVAVGEKVMFTMSDELGRLTHTALLAGEAAKISELLAAYGGVAALAESEKEQTP